MKQWEKGKINHLPRNKEKRIKSKSPREDVKIRDVKSARADSGDIAIRAAIYSWKVRSQRSSKANRSTFICRVNQNLLSHRLPPHPSRGTSTTTTNDDDDDDGRRGLFK